MKHILATACMLSMFFIGVAQDEAATDAAAEGPWKTGGMIGANFSQTYLSNWQGGGNNAINGTAIMGLFANYKKDAWTWDNTLDAAYGQTLIGEISTTNKFRKTDDRIEINSKLGHKTSVIHTYWAALATFRTQWDAGYDYGNVGSLLISDPFSPAYVLMGLGIDYKPSEAFSAYLSPATAKITIVDNARLSALGAYGVDPGETMRYEVGGYLKLAYSRNIVENVKLTTKADFFANYLVNFGNIDVNWETLIAMKINKFLSASLSTHLIYDDDIKIALDRNDDGVTDGSGPRVQFKEVFSLGLQYQF
jgi:hypothetical protein